MYKRVGGGVSKFGRNKFHQGRHNANGNIQQGKREPVNEIKGQRSDGCDNCGNWLKPNNRQKRPAKNFICNNCNRRGQFAKYCKKAAVN